MSCETAHDAKGRQIGDRAEQETFELTMERVRTAILLTNFEDLI
jgi:hypothetical protein